MLLIGALTSNGVPFGLLATSLFKGRKKPQTMHEIDDRSITESVENLNINHTVKHQRKKNKILSPLTKLFDRDLISDWCFWSYCLSSATFALCVSVNTVYTVRFAQSIGMTDYDAVFVASLIQIIIVIFSPISGIITSFSQKETSGETLRGNTPLVNDSRRSWILVSLQAVTGTIFLIPIISPTPAGMIGYSVLIGIFLGLISGLPYTVLADMFGTEKLPNALGIRSCFIGLFLLCLVPLVGMLVDFFDNFGVVMVMGCISGYASSISMSFAQYGISARLSRAKSEQMPIQKNSETPAEPGNRSQSTC